MATGARTLILYPANVVSPAEQARLFVKRIGDPVGLLTMLDIERDNGRMPRNRARVR
jgi:hypothetical protein